MSQTIGKVTKPRDTLLDRTNESQGKFSHAWIILFEQQKINPILGIQMARKLLLPTIISILIQHSKEECDGGKCPKHSTSKCLLP
jgi:hypothetical protein